MAYPVCERLKSKSFCVILVTHAILYYQRAGYQAIDMMLVGIRVAIYVPASLEFRRWGYIFVLEFASKLTSAQQSETTACHFSKIKR